MSVGDALAGARGQAGLTTAQVSERTRIREAVIRGIEQDDFTACGGDFYARGHIRSIARVVGADSEELIREYDAAHPKPHEMTAADVFEPSTPIRMRERRAPNLAAVMALALLVIVGYGVYRVTAGSGPSTPVASGRSHHAATHHHSPPASPSPSTSVTPPAPRGLVIQLTAVQDCWVEFTKPDGTYLSQANISAGASQTWHFRHSVTMQIGNPGGIELTVNGKDLVRPGAQTQPVTLSFGPGRPLPTVPTG